MTMKRNRRLLLKTAKRIEEIPQSYRQQTFRAKSARSPCGTVACLAGEIIICSERSVAKGIKKLEGVVNDWSYGAGEWPSSVAADLAGLTIKEASSLFGADASGWPRPFKSQFHKGRAKAAVSLLRYLATGGAVE